MRKEKKDSIKKCEIQHHDAHAEEYDHAHSCKTIRRRYMQNDFLKWLHRLNKDALVLEVGEGTGNDAIQVAKRGIDIVTSDISKKMLLVSNRKFKKENLMRLANFVVCDGEELPFTDESFDCVMIVGALHHLIDPIQSLEELHRCLKQNGYLIIGTEPNPWQFKLLFLKHSQTGRKIIKFLSKDKNKNKYTVDEVSPVDEITQGFKKKDIMEMLNRSDFRVLEFNNWLYITGFINVSGINIPKSFETFAIRVDKIIGKLPLIKNYSWHFNVLGQKTIRRIIAEKDKGVQAEVTEK